MATSEARSRSFDRVRSESSHPEMVPNRHETEEYPSSDEAARPQATLSRPDRPQSSFDVASLVCRDLYGPGADLPYPDVVEHFRQQAQLNSDSEENDYSLPRHAPSLNQCDRHRADPDLLVDRRFREITIPVEVLKYLQWKTRDGLAQTVKHVEQLESDLAKSRDELAGTIKHTLAAMLHQVQLSEVAHAQEIQRLEAKIDRCLGDNLKEHVTPKPDNHQIQQEDNVYDMPIDQSG